ncbi:MAG: class 1 isoprenoid biosynthesis enzyme [Methylococcaceae bacterium]|nr:MAG: class 1 isoprenoid biosynthesis enzyme [Methylococcaceae bacterium]
MPDLTLDAAIGAAWDIMEQRLAELPDSLAALARRFLDKVSEPDTGYRSYFSRPRSAPLLHIPFWLYLRLKREGCYENRGDLIPPRPPGAGRGERNAHADQALYAILAATMWGYIFIRIQDDLLDDPRLAEQDLSLFGNVCCAEMYRLYRWALPEAEDFWRGFDRVWLEFTAATLEERTQVLSDQPYPRALFENHARKVAFAQTPVLAVAALAGQNQWDALIAELINRLGVAFGLINDVMGWPRDLRSGQRTYLLAAAGWRNDTAADSIEAIEEQLRKALYNQGLLRAFLESAVEWFKLATESARALGLVEFDAYIEQLMAYLEEQKRPIALITLQRVLAGLNNG